MDAFGGYEEFPFVAEFYDETTPYRGREDVDFFVEEARRSGGPVLELGSGTGRVLIPTARAGVPITGLDGAEPMLERCRVRLAAESPETRARVELVRADMRDFALGRTFPLITCPFRPFQHLLTVADQISCLQAVRRHLGPGGQLILDLFNPSLTVLTDPALDAEFGSEPEFVTADGRKVIRRLRFTQRDLVNQINHAEIIFHVTHPDGRAEKLVHAFQIRYLFRYEAEHLLARCGFKLVAAYGDYRRSPFGARYPGELILVAEACGD